MSHLRAAVRMLRNQPTVSAIAVLTLALGIGANTAIFSVVDSVLLRPLPYREPAELVTLQNAFRDRRAGLSTMDIDDFRDQTGVFQALSAVLTFNANLTGGDQPERVQAVGTYANYFEIMGVAPFLGRTYRSDEQRKGWNELVVLSYGIWQRRFGGSPDVLGRTVRVDDDAYTVIGVMPPGFNHPDARITSNVDMWLPAGFAAEPFPEPTRHFRFLDAIGRLKPGISLTAGQTAVQTIADRLKGQYAEAYAPEPQSWSARIRPLDEQVIGGSRPGLLVLLGAVMLVLLVACSNVANLLLARASVRRREMAIRSALGATQRRLIAQLLGESILLSVIGGILGLLVAFWGIDLLAAFAPPELLRVRGFGVDWRVLGFTTVVSVGAGLLLGVIPAVQGSRTDPQAAMRDGGACQGRGSAALAIDVVRLAEAHDVDQHEEVAGEVQLLDHLELVCDLVQRLLVVRVRRGVPEAGAAGRGELTQPGHLGVAGGDVVVGELCAAACRRSNAHVCRDVDRALDRTRPACEATGLLRRAAEVGEGSRREPAVDLVE